MQESCVSLDPLPERFRMYALDLSLRLYLPSLQHVSLHLSRSFVVFDSASLFPRDFPMMNELTIHLASLPASITRASFTVRATW